MEERIERIKDFWYAGLKKEKVRRKEERLYIGQKEGRTHSGRKEGQKVRLLLWMEGKRKIVGILEGSIREGRLQKEEMKETRMDCCYAGMMKESGSK